MKLVKYITVILMGMIFFISTSGFVIYKSHCLYTGNKQVSVFITPEKCQPEEYNHNEHNSNENELSCIADQCKTCSGYTEDCGCSTPETIYFKLTNQIIDEEVKFTKIKPIQINIAFNTINIHILDEVEFEENSRYYIDPPPVFTTALVFLIKIQKLKIPVVA